MDKRWEELTNPEETAKRQEILSRGPMGNAALGIAYKYHAAKQEQEVVDARELLEELAEKLRAHKENGDAIMEWMKEKDIPGVDCWVYSLSEIEDNDIVGDALQWAASNHNC